MSKFIFWVALALIGQAAALQLIEAGNLLRYQHYMSFDRLLTEMSPSILILLVVQTVLVFAGLRSRWLALRTWIGRNFKLWQVFGIGLFFILSSAALQRDITLYWQDLVLSVLVQSVNFGNVLLVVWALPGDTLNLVKRILERSLGKDDGKNDASSAHIDRFGILAAIWVAIFASGLSLLVYEWHPHITDEVAYLYHARFLANGTLTLPAPPVPEAFETYLMEVKGDTWYPSTPPGWPAMLALGVRLGFPGLVNPLLAALNILLVYYLLYSLYDRRTARLASLLLSLSPWYVFMAMNFMNHTFLLTCALLAAVAVVRARLTGKAGWGWIAGAAVGIASLNRPLDGLIIGALIGLWVFGIGGKRLNKSSIAGFIIGTVVLGALVLPYNQMLTGSPTVFPLNAYVDSHFGPGKNDLGFGPNRGFGWPLQPFPGHSPIGATINANLNIFSINIELFGWSTGSLFFILLMLVSGSLSRIDYSMIAVCLFVFLLYFFYYYSGGPDFGARYWFLMIVPLVALTARGVYGLQAKMDLSTSSPGSGSTARGISVLVAVLLLSSLALVNYFPWRAIDKYYHFWGMSPEITALAKEYAFSKSLVLIRGVESHPDFASAAIYNPLNWDANAPIYAWDRDPAIRADLLIAFSDRPVWIVDAPSITGDRYKLAGGPVPARQLQAELNVAR